MILRLLRGTPLRRNSLILTITSPRTKLPNSGIKRPSRRMTRVQKHFRTFAIFTHRGRGATLDRGDTRSADGFGWNELDDVFATRASYNYALVLDVPKKASSSGPSMSQNPKLSSYAPIRTTTHHGVRQPACL
jgi:hypothetical protein